MAAPRVILNVEQGTTYEATLSLLNPDGSMYDLSGCTAKMQIRSAYNNALALVTLSTPDYTPLPSTITPGGLTLDAAAGTLLITMTPAQTHALPALTATNALLTAQVGSLGTTIYPPSSNYVFDLILVYPSGEVRRLMYGTVICTAAVTWQ